MNNNRRGRPVAAPTHLQSTQSTHLPLKFTDTATTPTRPLSVDTPDRHLALHTPSETRRHPLGEVYSSPAPIPTAINNKLLQGEQATCFILCKEKTPPTRRRTSTRTSSLLHEENAFEKESVRWSVARRSRRSLSRNRIREGTEIVKVADSPRELLESVCTDLREEVGSNEVLIPTTLTGSLPDRQWRDNMRVKGDRTFVSVPPSPTSMSQEDKDDDCSSSSLSVVCEAADFEKENIVSGNKETDVFQSKGSQLPTPVGGSISRDSLIVPFEEDQGMSKSTGVWLHVGQDDLNEGDQTGVSLLSPAFDEDLIERGVKLSSETNSRDKLSPIRERAGDSANSRRLSVEGFSNAFRPPTGESQRAEPKRRQRQTSTSESGGVADSEDASGRRRRIQSREILRAKINPADPANKPRSQRHVSEDSRKAPSPQRVSVSINHCPDSISFDHRPGSVSAGKRSVSVSAGQKQAPVVAGKKPASVSAGRRLVSLSAGQRPVSVSMAQHPVSASVNQRPVSVTVGQQIIAGAPGRAIPRRPISGPSASLSRERVPFHSALSYQHPRAPERDSQIPRDPQIAREWISHIPKRAPQSRPFGHQVPNGSRVPQAKRDSLPRGARRGTRTIVQSQAAVMPATSLLKRLAQHSRDMRGATPISGLDESERISPPTQGDIRTPAHVTHWSAQRGTPTQVTHWRGTPAAQCEDGNSLDRMRFSGPVLQTPVRVQNRMSRFSQPSPSPTTETAPSILLERQPTPPLQRKSLASLLR